MEQLLEELELYFSHSSHCLALTGSGGKTTCMVKLAKHYADKGLRVLVSTTTKLLLPKDQEYGCDTYFLDDRALSHHPVRGERVFYAHATHKAVSPPLAGLEALLDRYDVLLLEADGAKNQALKLHEERDPVIPFFVTGTLALVSMSPLGKIFGENCFGSHAYPKDFPEELVGLDTYRKLLEHKQGILKRMQGKGLVLCNQSKVGDTVHYKSISSVPIAYPLWFGDLESDQLIYRNPS